MSKRIGFDEVSEVGALFFSACFPIEPNGFQIEVSEAYDDSDRDRDCVLLEVHGGEFGLSFNLSVDEAEALASILRHTAKTVRSMNEHLRKEAESED
jgi:hypothetical protein